MRLPKVLAPYALAALLVAGCTGDATTPVGPPVAEAPSASTGKMYVTVSGPTDVVTWWTCTWYVYVTGGTAPYSYHWSAQGMIETEADFNYWRGYPAHGGWVSLHVTVTDALGKVSSGYLMMDSSNNAPLCME